MRPNNSGRILNIVRWFFAVFTALVALVPISKGGIGILSGIFVLAVAFLISPLSSRFPVKTAPKVIVCVALFFIGVGISPSSSKKSVETVEREPPEIVETEVTTAETTTFLTETTTAAADTPTDTPTEKSTTSTDTATETTAETTTTAEPATTTKVTTKKKKTTTTPKPTTTTTTTTTSAATTTTTTTTATEQFVVPDKSVGYVANTNTKKFHRPDCKSVKDIKPENRWDFNGDRSELIAQGYSPCGNCHP